MWVENNRRCGAAETSEARAGQGCGLNVRSSLFNAFLDHATTTTLTQTTCSAASSDLTISAVIVRACAEYSDIQNRSDLVDILA